MGKYPPIIYPIYVMFYPFYRDKFQFLGTSFLLGLGMDVFLGTWGINAFATTLMAFTRTVIFRSSSDSTSDFFSFESLQWTQFLGFILTNLFLHQFLVQFIEYFKLIPGRAVMFATHLGVHWDNLIGNRGMPYETNLIFKLDKDDAYIVSGYFRIPSNNGKEPANWKAKEKEMLDGMEKRYRADFLKGLRERQEYEVPNQSGICLIRGFIADDGGKPFKANTAVRFAKQTDMRLEMLHGAVLQPGEPTLLERDLVSEKSALAKIFKTAGYRTIRQGKRDLNGMSGTEKLIKWQGNKYMLIWERDGGDPRIMMKFGADRAEGTSRSEAEILAIWDTVLPTLKPVK